MSLLPDDRMDVQTLVQAFEDCIKARTEHDRALGEYDGYSWGYAGYNYVNSMNAAAEDLGKRLDQYIDQRVAAALTSRT